MQRIKMLATGEVKEVTNNVAFGLVDSGKAKLFTGEVKPIDKYANRAMTTSPTQLPNTASEKVDRPLKKGIYRSK